MDVGWPKNDWLVVVGCPKENPPPELVVVELETAKAVKVKNVDQLVNKL